MASAFKNKDHLKLAHSLILALKGTPFILFGDELGLEGKSELENIMQWDNSSGCGFTNNKEIGEHFKSEVHCENSAELNYLLDIYKNMNMLRKEPAFVYGDVKLVNVESQNVVSFIREAKNHEKYLILINIGRETESIFFEKNQNIPEKGKVSYYQSTNLFHDLKVTDEISLKSISLSSTEFLIIKLL